MEVGMGMAVLVKGIILLTCLEGYVSSSPIHNMTIKEVILQLHSLNTNAKLPSCNSSMVWQVNFEKDKPCATLEVLNNITNCPEIEPLKRNMNSLLGNSSSDGTFSGTCLEVQNTKIQLSRFLKDLHRYLMKYNRNWIFKSRLGNFTKE